MHPPLKFRILFIALTVIYSGVLQGQIRSKKDTLITGRITSSAAGTAVAGLSVSYLNLAETLTDNTGYFSLKVPHLWVSLDIRGQGYPYKQVALKGKSKLEIVLYQNSLNTSFDEVTLNDGVLRTKTKITGAVDQIDMTGVGQYSRETPDSYFQGKIAGLGVTRHSGTPGRGALLTLRGLTSINTSNQPLIVVDGIIYDNENYGSSLVNAHRNNPLQSIDLKDIDQVTVIKDALNTYGTKGANGVILINTIHARQLATKIDFDVNTGINIAPRGIPLLNAAQYRTYLSDIFQSAGYTNQQVQALPYLDDQVSNPDYHLYHHDTNWQKEVFKNSYSQNYYLNITGGDNIAKYALSAGYLKSDGIIQNTGLTRYNTRFNADLNLTKKLTAAVNLAFTYNQQNLTDQGLALKTNPLYLALVKSPFIPVNEVNANGNVSPNLSDTDIFNVSNPAAIIKNAQQANKNYRFNSQVNVNYRFSNKLNLTSIFGITYDKVRETNFIPAKGVAVDTLSNALAKSRLGSRVQRLFTVNNDTRISYQTTVGQFHELAFRAGFRFNNSRSEDDYALGYNSATDDLISVGTGLSSLRQVGGDIGKWRWINQYLSADYGYAGKYFLNANLSTDQSSRFGADIPNDLSLGGVHSAVLPSAGVSWLVSSEQFLAGAGWLDQLKLRLSYGLTGNDNIGNYSARNYYVSQNLLGMEGLVRGNIANTALQWETVKKANVGADFLAFKERLQLSADFYQNTTSNMLTYESTGASTGLPLIITNNGGLTTRGLDISASYRILNGAVNWVAGITLSKYRSELTRLPQNPFIVTNSAGASYIAQVGSQPNLFYGYMADGVYQSDAIAAAANKSTLNSAGILQAFKGGDVNFRDINNDQVIDDQDRVVIGNPNPDFTGSLINTFQWKRWSLDALVTFSSGGDVFNYTRYQLESQSSYNNQTPAVINRWRSDGQETDVPRASYGDPLGNSRFSSRWIADGSYIRLRSLSLSYQIPKVAGVFKYVTVYASATNLITLSHYLGYDPEFNAGGGIFNAGTDYVLEPQYQSVQLGIRIGL